MQCLMCGQDIPEKAERVSDFIAAYAEQYLARTGRKAIIGGRNAGIAKRIVEAVGLETAIKLVPVFLSMPQFHQRGFSMADFEYNLSAINLHAGRALPSKTESKAQERRQANPFLKQFPKGGSNG